MKVFTLYREQHLPISIEEAWNYFSSPRNLSKITPAYMQFKIVSKLESEKIFEGMSIEYDVRPLLNAPMRWVTRIEKINEPFSFTDVQVKGPYKLWRHKHSFFETPNGVLMTDHVSYAIPFGWAGVAMNWLFIRRQLNGIFGFRREVLKTMFSYG